MTNADDQRLEKSPGNARRLLAVLVGLLAVIGLVASGASPASAQNAVGPQHQNLILAVGAQTVAAQTSIGTDGLTQLRQASATGVAADTEGSAAARALARLPKAARDSEKPPGFNPESWQWPEGSRTNVPRSWWDPEGGEWRFHPEDKYHDPHWDYNPWQQWNSPSQHLYPGN